MEGQAFWSVIGMCETQIRVAGLGGVLGLDFAAVTAMAEASGLDGRVTARLLPFAEAGVWSGIRRRRGVEEPT